MVARLRRVVLLAGVVALFAWAAAGPILHLASLAGAGDWGSDWRWLEDGLARLGRGLPLNHPEYVAGRYSQLVDGPAYTWSLHPPYNATLAAPLLLLPATAREPAWAALMATAVAAAAWLVWPRRLWWGTSLVLAAVVLGPPFQGPSIGLVDQLHFANPNALVLLGLPLAWSGRRGAGSVATARAGTVLMAAGLVLAAVKIVPAVAMAAWLLAARGPARRPAAIAVAAAAGILVLLTLPVVALDPGVITDTLAVQLNIDPWTGATNLAPAVRLAPLLGSGLATWLSRLVGAGLLGLVLARGLDGRGGFVLAAVAPLLLTPQLWAHWLLLPIAAALLAAGDSAGLRVIDARLRAIAAGRATTRPDVRGAAGAG